MDKEEKITDGAGLQTSSLCVYCQINGSDMDRVKQVLSDNDIPNKLFMTAGAAFCESQADFKLRCMCDNSPDGSNIEAATKIGIMYREHIGSRMYENIEDFVNFEEMDDFVSKCFAKKFANEILVDKKYDVIEKISCTEGTNDE